MDLINDILHAPGRWLTPRLGIASMAMIACLLTIYGDQINRWIGRKVKSQFLVFRLAIFVSVCAFGYGAVSLATARVIEKGLRHLDGRLLLPTLMAAFLLIGYLAQRRKQM